MAKICVKQQSGLARHMDINTLLLQNSHMTLKQAVLLLPQSDKLGSALDTMLAAVGRTDVTLQSDR